MAIRCSEVVPTRKATPGATWPSSAGEMDDGAGVLRQRGLPHQVRKGAGSFDPAADTIKVLTMNASKGLEFPVLALVGAEHMPAPGEDEREEARLFYVGATRATQRLIIGLGGDGRFGQRLEARETAS